jgi:hypothetical protein
VEPNTIQHVIEPTGALAKIFADYGIDGILAFFGVLLVFQFLFFMWKLRARSKRIDVMTDRHEAEILELNKYNDDRFDRLTTDLTNTFQKQSDEYGRLLEARHEQFCDILERTIVVMSACKNRQEQNRNGTSGGNV